MENEALNEAVRQAQEAARRRRAGGRAGAHRRRAGGADRASARSGARFGGRRRARDLRRRRSIPFVFRLSIFVLAIFVGYYVVWSVTPALHTPLMSVTNAISSVIVVGALLAVGVDLVGEGTVIARFFGFFALMLASVNIFGGFLVTQRMLGMYRRKERA